MEKKGLFFFFFLYACSQGGYINEPPLSTEQFQILLSRPDLNQDGGIEEALVDILKKATFSIDCAFQSLSSEKVIEILLEKASSKAIRTRIAFDIDVRNTDIGAKKLYESNLFSTSFDFQNEDKLLLGNKGEGQVFYTFCSVDERYNFISTYGINPAKLNKIPVVALLLHGDQYGIARELLKEMNMLSQGVFGYRKSKLDFATKYTVLDQVVAIYWAPQENPMDLLGQELAQAEKSVDFYTTSFRTTNNTQKKLLYDVPTILYRLETLKGKTVRKYFAFSAYLEKDGKVFSLPNPLQYQNFESVPGTNIFIVDRNGPNPTTFIYTGSLRSRANSSDDGILLELRGSWLAQKLGEYLDNTIAPYSQYVSNIGDEAFPGAVIVNEVMWMGSYDNQGVSYSNDEFIELYNTTDSVINLSSWKFACTTNGSSANAAITIPAGIVIGPKGYLVVATSEFGAFSEKANLFDPKLKITNSSRECRLGNGRNSSTMYGVPDFGSTIDTIGNNVNGFDSTTWGRGLNDSTNKIRRSMERTNIGNEDGTKGSDKANWRTNVSSVSENQWVSEFFNQGTFGTPGAPNSAGDVGVPGEVVISEVMWMGSYDNSGNSDSDDEFIEIYNTTTKRINISGWQFACTTDGTSNNAAIVFPAGTYLEGQSYLVIATKPTGAFSDIAHIFHSKLKITNSSRECRLGDSSTSTTVYGIAGFGVTIDTIGDNTNGFDSSAWGRGLNDSTNKIRRSMERISLTSAGTSNNNWITNQYTVAQNNQVNANFKNSTFASPSLAVSLPPSANPGDVVINEIMWMGSYDNNGVGDTYDEFIELKNTTASAISLSGWKITGSGVSTITIPPGNIIPANGYFVIARNNTKAFPSADFYTGGALNISNSSFQIELRDSFNTLIDTAGNGGAPLAGVNDTTNKIRKSMERRSPPGDGSQASQWYTCALSLGGSHVQDDYKNKTLATPKEANSTPQFNVTGALATSATTLLVYFSEPPVGGTGSNGAQNLSNYSLTGGLTISGATLSGSTVTLTTSSQTAGTNYTVTVSNVQSASTTSNLTNNTASFTGFGLPQVKSVTPLSPTILDVNFDSNIDATTVEGFPERFEITPSLTVNSALLMTTDPHAYKRVRLSTQAQNPSTQYTLTVSNDVKNEAGYGIDPSKNSGQFYGFHNLHGIMDDTTAGMEDTAKWQNEGAVTVSLQTSTTAQSGSYSFTWASLTTNCENNSGSGRHALTNSYYPITPGGFYLASLYLKGGNVTTGGSVRGRIRIFWYKDNLGTAASTANTLDDTPEENLTNNSPWTQRARFFTAPIDAYYMKFKFCGYRSGGNSADELFIDEANFRQVQNHNFSFEDWSGGPGGWSPRTNIGIPSGGFTQNTTSPKDGTNFLRISGTTTSSGDILVNSAPVNRGNCTHLAIWFRGTGSSKAVVVQTASSGNRFFNINNTNLASDLTSALEIVASSSANYSTGLDTSGNWKIAFLKLTSAPTFESIKFRFGSSSTYNLDIDALGYYNSDKTPCTP